MFEFLQNKIVNRVRQYGYTTASKQLCRIVYRRLYLANVDIIFMHLTFAGHIYHDSCIKPLTLERLQQVSKSGVLEKSDIDLLLSFQAEGSQGVCAVIDGELAGYAWVQSGGLYSFGRSGKLLVTSPFAVLKNLYVLPKYRGRGIGRKLNEARLAIIPADRIPVVFIIPENQIAIRNWEIFGFQRIIQVKCWRWLAGSWHMKIDRLSEHEYVESMEKALIKGNREKLEQKTDS